MKSELTGVLLLLLACAAVSAFTLHNGFHLDDYYRVLNNPGVESFWPPWRHFVDPSTCASAEHLVQYRPLLPLSLSINHAISGHSVVGYHVGNALLHFAASLAVLGLLRELLTSWNRNPTGAKSAPHAAWILTGLFVAHPLSLVAVNYICGRDLLLMQAFTIGAMWVYVRMRRIGASKGRWTLTLTLFVLALLSKKNAVALPAVVLAFEVIVVRQPIRSGPMWRRFGAFAGCAAAVLVFIRFGLGFSDFANVVTHSWQKYATAQLQHHVFHYLANFVWPLPIRMLAADPVATWKIVLGSVVIIGLLALAWRWRGARPLAAFSIVAYFAMIALTTSVLPMHSEIVSYRAYPGSPYVWLLLGALATGHPTVERRVLPILFGLLLIALFSLSRTFEDTRSLMEHSIAYGGNNIAYAKLGELSRPADAKPLFERAIELEPNFVGAHIGLARVDVQLGNKQAGLRRLETWVNKASENPQVLSMGARILALAGEPALAVQMAEASVQLAPQLPLIRTHAGRIAFEAKRFDKAIEWLAPLRGSSPEVDRILDASAGFIRR